MRLLFVVIAVIVLIGVAFAAHGGQDDAFVFQSENWDVMLMQFPCVAPAEGHGAALIAKDPKAKRPLRFGCWTSDGVTVKITFSDKTYAVFLIQQPEPETPDEVAPLAPRKELIL